jgi:hypothetical protein
VETEREGWFLSLSYRTASIGPGPCPAVLRWLGNRAPLTHEPGKKREERERARAKKERKGRRDGWRKGAVKKRCCSIISPPIKHRMSHQAKWRSRFLEGRTEIASFESLVVLLPHEALSFSPPTHPSSLLLMVGSALFLSQDRHSYSGRDGRRSSFKTLHQREHPRRS